MAKDKEEIRPDPVWLELLIQRNDKLFKELAEIERGHGALESLDV